MKKIKKILLNSSVLGLSLLATTTNVYAINSYQKPIINSRIVSTVVSDFNYLNYSKESLTKLLDFLDEKVKENQNYANQYRYFEFEIQEVLDEATDSGKNVLPIYILEDRISYGINNLNQNSDDYYFLLSDIKNDIATYEEKLKLQEIERKKKELEDFRGTQVIWTEHFMQMFSPGFDYDSKDFELNSINIYDFFEDGEYCSPVSNQSLSMISNYYSKNHYGVDINVPEGTEIYSIANNSIVKLKDNEVVLTLPNGVEVCYLNIIPNVKNDSIVNKGDCIGTFILNDDSYDGLFLQIKKDSKEYSCEWLLTEYPFITENGFSMPLYLQGDSLWKDNAYGCTTIGPSGCGPSALAMAVSYLNNEIITPAQLVNDIGGANSKYLCPGQGSYWTLMDEVPEMYGLKSRRISSSEIADCLAEGNPVIAIMGPGEFTSGGHFITLSGLDGDGNVYVNDSADSFSKQHFDTTFTISSIASEARGFWVIYK